jgi:hypothetical protein
MSSITIPKEGLALDSTEIFPLLLTPEEIQEAEKQDKINVAYHEAGHAVLALELRCDHVRASIERNPNGPSFGEHGWIGNCQYWALADLLEVVAPAIGVAGEVAVLMLKGEWHEAMPWDLGLDAFNETDARSLTEDNVVMALRDASEILEERWSRVEAIAQALLQDEFLTDGMILEIIGREAA